MEILCIFFVVTMFLFSKTLTGLIILVPFGIAALLKRAREEI